MWFEDDALGKEALLTRASEDLACPAELLEYATRPGRRHVETVHVTGCDARATYVLQFDDDAIIDRTAYWRQTYESSGR